MLYFEKYERKMDECIVNELEKTVYSFIQLNNIRKG